MRKHNSYFPIFFHIIAFSFIWIASCHVVWAQTAVTGGIEGQVNDNVMGKPVAEAVVLLINQDTEAQSATKTDTNGMFHLGLIPPGNYTIRISKAGYISYENELIARATQTRSLGLFSLVPKASTVKSGINLAALDQKPELYVQSGHSGVVTALALSRDGQLLASGSQDSTIKLWNVANRSELCTIQAFSSRVVSLAFSPDGRFLAGGGGTNMPDGANPDNIVKIWDTETGREVRRFIGHSMWVSTVNFSPDGSLLASASWDGTVKLWDVAKGSLSYEFGVGHEISAAVFDPDGKYLAIAAWDNTIKLWDLRTRQFTVTYLGHSAFVTAVAFSPDGRTLISGDNEATIRLWDRETGRELRRFPGHRQPVSAINAISNGQFVSASFDGTIRLWEISTGSEIRTLANYNGRVLALALSSDRKVIFAAGPDQNIHAWNSVTGIEQNAFTGHTASAASFALSPDGKTLAITQDKQIRIWDLIGGQGSKFLAGHTDWINSVSYSPDSKTLASASSDKSIRLWDVATGRQLQVFATRGTGVFKALFSQDGKLLVTAERGVTKYDWEYASPIIRVWDLVSGRELRAIVGPREGFLSLNLSPDGKLLASGNTNHTITLWDVASGTVVKQLQGHTCEVGIVMFSPDGKSLASGGARLSGGCSDTTIRLWNVQTGAQTAILTGHTDFVTALSFLANGTILASGSFDSTVRLWNVDTGREIRALAGAVRTYHLSVTRDDRKLFGLAPNGRIVIWDIQSGEELVSLISLDEQDWLATTPNGLFDGTPSGWQYVKWRFNGNTFQTSPVEVFFNDYYYPGLLTKVLSGRQAPVPQLLGSLDRRQLRIDFASSSVDDKTRLAKVMLTIREAGPDAAHSQGGGVRDVRLFRNGSLVKVWRGDVLKGKSSVTLEATVPIVAGENRLTGYAFNHDNIKSSDATLTVTGADSLKRKGVAYVLAVGVNEYANSQYNLKYAVADAQDFAEETKLQQGKVNNYERVEIVALNDKDATKANILKALADLSAKIQPEDALVIFFAGHGTAQQNRFYLIPYDLGYTGGRTQLNSAGLQNILAHSVSDEEISRAVEGIDAGQMLLVIDACNSGQALEAEEKRRGPMNSKGLAQLAYEKGMYILTAAQSYQAAQEAARLGHGFLTYALVEEGLKTGAADREPKDGQVLLREWLDFATERVPQMQQDELDQQKKQGRQLDRIRFAEADSGNERSIQRPRVFYRREAETHPLVVAKP